jgi:glycosyltransferase involved in cell wall biosynthesis
MPAASRVGPDAAAEDLSGVRVCYFGHFSHGYPRNETLRAALTAAGADVVDVWDESSNVAVRYWRLLRAARGTRFDVLFVGWPGHTDVPLAWLLGKVRRAPVVFDAYVSIWETQVVDRGRFEASSARARLLALLDRSACRLATVVLFDTDAHIRFAVERFRLDRTRFRRVPIAADSSRAPCPPNAGDGPFRVCFYSTFMPLHGAEVIVGAAAKVYAEDPSIQFELIGDGPTLGAVRQRAAELAPVNIAFTGPIGQEELRRRLCSADVCLGIFGTTGKASRVLPNKVIDALALGRPVVTGDTEGARELLTDGVDAVLCAPGDEGELAAAILRLSRDPELRSAVASGGRALFERRFSLDALRRTLVPVMREALSGYVSRPRVSSSGQLASCSESTVTASGQEIPSAGSS